MRVFTFLPLTLDGGSDFLLLSGVAGVVASYGTHIGEGEHREVKRFISAQWVENSVSLLVL